MKKLVIIAALALSACAPPETAGTSALSHERLNFRYMYSGDVQMFSVTEFTNSIGEHCTVADGGSGVAMSCSPKVVEQASAFGHVKEVPVAEAEQFLLESSKP